MIIHYDIWAHTPWYTITHHDTWSYIMIHGRTYGNIGCRTYGNIGHRTYGNLGRRNFRAKNGLPRPGQKKAILKGENNLLEHFLGIHPINGKYDHIRMCDHVSWWMIMYDGNDHISWWCSCIMMGSCIMLHDHVLGCVIMYHDEWYQWTLL